MAWTTGSSRHLTRPCGRSSQCASLPRCYSTIYHQRTQPSTSPWCSLRSRASASICHEWRVRVHCMLLAFQMDVRILTAIAWCGWRGRASRLEEAHQIDEWCVYLLFCSGSLRRDVSPNCRCLCLGCSTRAGDTPRAQTVQKDTMHRSAWTWGRLCSSRASWHCSSR